MSLLLLLVRGSPPNVVLGIVVPLAVLVATWTYYSEFCDKNRRKAVKAFFCFSAIGVLVFLYEYDTGKPSSDGRLVPSETVLSYPLDAWKLIEIGDSGVLIGPGLKNGGYDLDQFKPLLSETNFELKQTNPWTVVGLPVKGSRLSLSMIIRDKDFLPIVEIVDNEWKTGNQAWDRNYNSDSLEVMGPEGDVVLQIRLLPDRVKFQGKWYRRDGSRCIVMQSNGTNRPVQGYALFAPRVQKDGIDNRAFKITPLFVYPSARHLGQLANRIMPPTGIQKPLEK